VAGLPEPKVVNGIPQVPIEGTSFAYSFNDAAAAERHTIQYFELFGNRALYYDGWFARTIHRAPWEMVNLPPLEDDVWELYNTREDFSLYTDLASKYPERLKEMKDLFMWQAQKYHVLPIDDRVIERTNAAIAGRPDLIGDRKSLSLYEGMDGMMENTFINIKNKSFSITADLNIPESGAKGAILSQGGRFGGWSLYLKDGVPGFTYNWLGLDRYVMSGAEVLSAGPVTIKMNFDYDGEAGDGKGKGGKAVLFVDGKEIATTRIDKTQPNLYSADETADVGVEIGRAHV
jgi:arylsulfatase